MREWHMDPLALRELRPRLVAFAWNEWAQMGVLAEPSRVSPWAQDPEALIVFTLEVARAEPRLFDELLDWMLVNEVLLSVRRLRAMCLDEVDRALVDATIAWLARRRPRARLRGAAANAGPDVLEHLFRNGGPIGEADPDFAAAGLLRPPLTPSGKSLTPDLDTPIDLGFRLRAILGVGIRAEVVRIMLTADGPWMTAQTLAHASGYAKRNVHDALAGLSAANVVTAFTVGGEQRYTIDKPAWAALLGRDPIALPSHRDWPQLLGVLRTILRWSELQTLRDDSDYLRSSSARQLLHQIRPELAFAGIPIDSHPTAESAPRQLQLAVEALLVALDPAGGPDVSEAVLSIL
jgi:hypothetical protein